MQLVLHQVFLWSVLVIDMLSGDNGESYKRVFLKVGFVHINSGDLVIFIGGVIINSFIGVAAGGVKGNLKFSFAHIAAASLLVNGAENMEKLAYAFRLAFSRNGIHFRESDPCKS